MKIKRIIICLVFALSITACSTKEEPKETNNQISENKQYLRKYDTVFYEYLDTVSTFIAYTENEEDFKKYKDILEEDLKKYDQLYNSYDSFDGVNNIKTINENAGKKPVKVEPEIIELLDFSKDFYAKSNGKINIAMGRLIKLWHNERDNAMSNPEKAKIPSKESLEEAAQYDDIDKIVIDKTKNEVYIDDSNIQMDVGAIAKGFALKNIEEDLRDAGVKNAIVSVGGDDVIIGENPEKEDGTFKIAIENPVRSKDEPYSSIIDLKYTTVVTSGDYQRYFKIGDKIYHHIIDSDTMYPSQYFKSVSVIHDDIALADSLSTYLFTVDLEEGKKIAEEYGAEVFWIDNDLNEYRTEGYEKFEE